MNALLLLATCLAIIIPSYFILKRYNPIFIMLTQGMAILIIASLLTSSPIPLPKDIASQGILLDAFQFLTLTCKKTLAGVGLIIMSVAGFAAYMKHIHASSKLAFLANKPLSHIRNPYLILSGTFIIGMALKMVISSYAGLMILLLASIYPVLLACGIRPLTAVSTLSLIALDYGPKDANSINMASMVGQADSVVEIFLHYQLYSVLAYVVLIALCIPFYYRFMDARDNAKEAHTQEQHIITNPPCPNFYILFPWLPIILLFSAYIAGIKLDVVSANFLSISLVFLIEFARHKNGKKIAEDIMVILRAMAEIFISVVSIIIAASIFAEGIKALGGLGIIAHSVAELGNIAVLGSIVLLSLLVFGASMIMGSGIAAFNALGRLALDIAPKLHIPPIALVLPIEIASCLGRAASPIAGGILVLAGFSKIEPLAIIKRSLPLLLLGMVANIAVAYYFALMG